MITSQVNTLKAMNSTLYFGTPLALIFIKGDRQNEEFKVNINIINTNNDT